jgi:hypothetical protein
MDSLEELFCHIDDFCQQFEPKWHSLLLGEGVQLNAAHQQVTGPQARHGRNRH